MNVSINRDRQGYNMSIYPGADLQKPICDVNEKTARILVVDTDDTMLKLHCCALRLDGYLNIVPAATYREADDHLQRAKCDLIVFDVSLQHPDGFPLLHRINRRPETCETPIILILSSDDPDLLKLAQTERVDAMLAKPFPIDDLTTTLALLLSRQEAS